MGKKKNNSVLQKIPLNYLINQYELKQNMELKNNSNEF